MARRLSLVAALDYGGWNAADRLSDSALHLVEIAVDDGLKFKGGMEGDGDHRVDERFGGWKERRYGLLRSFFLGPAASLLIDLPASI
jgi:hypothetical protein